MQLSCSNKWCHSLRDSCSEQNVMGARWVVVYDLHIQGLTQFVFYQPCPVLGILFSQLTIPSTYGATRALRLGRRLGKLSGKQPRNSGRRLWQGLCLLSGDFAKIGFTGNIFIFIFVARRMSSRVLVPLPISTTK